MAWPDKDTQDLRQVYKAEWEKVFTLSEENSNTKTTARLAAGQRKVGMLWITGRGKPLAHTQGELRGISSSRLMRLAALPLFSFVLLRLHSRWLLCFIQKNAQILRESHIDSNAHPSVSCVSCCRGLVTSHTKRRLIGGKYEFCFSKVKSTLSKNLLNTLLEKHRTKLCLQCLFYSDIKINE